MSEEKENNLEFFHQKKISLSVFSVSSGTLLSRFLGLLRDAALAYNFDKTTTDAFVAAFRLPNFFRRLLGEGSFAASFIPMYVSANQEPHRGDHLKGAVFSFLLIISSILSVLGFVFMEDLLPLLLSGEAYSGVSGKMVFTIWLARIMFFYLFLVTNYAFFMSIAQVHRRFFIPAMAPALFNLAFIIFIFLPKSWFLVKGSNLAYGVLVGGLLQVFVVALLLFQIKQFPKPNLNFKTWGFGKTLGNLVPGMVGMGVVQIMNIINLLYLSRLSEGSISYIYYADRILEMPQSLIAISLGVVLLPTLSRLWAEGSSTKMLQLLSENFNLLLFLILPSAVGMFVLAKPLVELLFVRGEFNLEDARQTIEVVQIYSLILIAASSTKLLINGFYATKNTWLPALFTAISIGLHILLAPIFMRSYGLQGLVYSMTLAAYVNLALSLIAFIFVVGSLNLSIIKSSIQHLFCALIMGSVVYLFQLWADSFSASALGRAGLLFVAVFSGVFVYFFLCGILKSSEAQYFRSIVLNKFKKNIEIDNS